MIKCLWGGNGHVENVEDRNYRLRGIANGKHMPSLKKQAQAELVAFATS